MTTPTQPGSPSDYGRDPAEHLDPDRLSAFLEGVLPEPERLASVRHLAECASCRELAFLVQSADPAFAPGGSLVERSPIAVVRTSPAGRYLRPPVFPWLRRPVLAGFSLAALACCVFAILFVQLRRNSTPATPGGDSLAAAHAPEPSPEPSLQPSPAPAPVSPDLATRRNAPSNPFLRVPGEQQAAAPFTRPPAQPALAPPALAANSASAPLPSQPAPGSSVPSPAAKPAAPEGFAQPRAAQRSLELRSTAAAAQASGVPPGTASSTPAPAAPLHAGSLDEPASAPAITVEEPPPGSVTRAGALAAPTRKLPPADRSTSAGEGTVAINAMNAPARKSTGSLEAPALPSTLPSVASAVSGKRLLSVDTAGTLFYSTSRGEHWKRIKPRWPGTIQTLQLTADMHFQITTTTGAVWLSPDGRHWAAR